MANEQLNPPSKTTGKMGGRRGFIKKAGVAVPVVMTLSARKAIGAPAQCYSVFVSAQMNNSHAHAPNCETGNNPAYYASPLSAGLPPSSITSTPMSVTNGGDWADAGYTYATQLDTSPGTDCSHYSGGSTFSDMFSVTSTTPEQEARAILCNSSGSTEAVYITALLNSKNTSLTNYPLTEGQVRDLFSNYGSNSNAIAFLTQTW